MDGGRPGGPVALELNRRRSARQQAGRFRIGQVAPLARRQIAQMDVADAYALQALHPVAERRTHAADLPIESLGENQANGFPVDAAHLARLGYGTGYLHAARQHGKREVRDRAIDGDDVLLFVIIFRAQQFIDDIAVVGQQNQTFGILVQSPDGKNPVAVADQIDDVVLDVRLGRAGGSHRLVEHNVDLLLLGAYECAVHAHFIGRANLEPQHCADAVAGDASRLYPFIGFAPRATARFADEFVQPHATLRVSPSQEGADMIGRVGTLESVRGIERAIEDQGRLRGRELARHGGRLRQYQSANEVGPSGREFEGNRRSKSNAQHVDPAQAQIARKVRYGAGGVGRAEARRRIGFAESRQIGGIHRAVARHLGQKPIEAAARTFAGVQTKERYLLIESAARGKRGAHVHLPELAVKIRAASAYAHRGRG